MRAVEKAFRAEAARLSEVVLALDEEQLSLPTPCAPWSVQDLLAHVRTATGRLTVMLAESAPPTPEIDAAGYYRPEIFDPELDAARVAAAQREAAADGAGLAADFDRTWRAVADLVAAAPPDRVVRTRHGDAIRLDDFLVTRVVEVGVHGLDFAIALDRPPWLTGPAAEVIEDLLLADSGVTTFGELGWDRTAGIARLTGRMPFGASERAVLDQRGVRWLRLS
jgi:uncharacterized protein (TIGR03083 family)